MTFRLECVVLSFTKIMSSLLSLPRDIVNYILDYTIDLTIKDHEVYKLISSLYTGINPRMKWHKLLTSISRQNIVEFCKLTEDILQCDCKPFIDAEGDNVCSCAVGRAIYRVIMGLEIKLTSSEVQYLERYAFFTYASEDVESHILIHQSRMSDTDVIKRLNYMAKYHAKILDEAIYNVWLMIDESLLHKWYKDDSNNGSFFCRLDAIVEMSRVYRKLDFPDDGIESVMYLYGID